MNITGNTILITGGGSGIGLGLAQSFLALGNKVIIAGRRKQLLDKATAANPGMASAVLDIADPAAIKTFATQLIKDHPTLNAVIHNAGVMNLENFLSQTDGSAAEAMITTNLLGPIRLTAELLPHFQKQPAATIVTVSSGLAFVPLAPTPTYSATKAAIHSWTQSLRYQLQSTKIQVIELPPPYVQTELMGPGQASDPRAMPLDAFIAEVMDILKTQPEATEILVKNVLPLRYAEQSGPEKYNAFFKTLNDSMSAH